MPQFIFKQNGFGRLFRIAAVLLVCAMLFPLALCGCNEGPDSADYSDTDEYVENIDALKVYYRFIYSLESAEIEKRVTTDNDLYGILSSTVSTIKFDRSGERHLMLYRERTPFVFFFYPEYDFYDGTNYYYQYDGNWFADSTNRHAHYLNTDFLGIPADIFADYDITFNALYTDGDDYILKIQGKHRETGMLCQINGRADSEFNITNLQLIEEYADKKGNIHHKHTDMKYTHINGSVEIAPPKSLNFDEVNYFK
ncbi:MAG: hypothetical protein IJC94_08250 [Oscillospiraceae bacterium]|nr:hypothetical protein [Oscillospiraceae bacterium]MBQ9938285.1 hypothetical protein [Oscillospiraceae bacterium]